VTARQLVVPPLPLLIKSFAALVPMPVNTPKQMVAASASLVQQETTATATTLSPNPSTFKLNNAHQHQFSLHSLGLESSGKDTVSSLIFYSRRLV
jgi:hypothetical protein